MRDLALAGAIAMGVAGCTPDKGVDTRDSSVTNTPDSIGLSLAGIDVADELCFREGGHLPNAGLLDNFMRNNPVAENLPRGDYWVTLGRLSNGLYGVGTYNTETGLVTEQRTAISDRIVAYGLCVMPETPQFEGDSLHSPNYTAVELSAQHVMYGTLES